MERGMKGYIGVKEIYQADDRYLGITWTDGAESKLDVVELRRKCPCAACVDERTGERILKPDSIANSVRPLQIDSVGRYACVIAFNDGHNTGIYSFKYLRNLSGISLS